MKEEYLVSEIIREDDIVEFHRGRIRIKDCVFEYENRVEGIFVSGDVNPDLSRKYKEVDTDVFSVTMGKSLIYNDEVNQNYTHYRLIEIVL